jgi:drug/metabolite transporter (DMT)-like permease
VVPQCLTSPPIAQVFGAVMLLAVGLPFVIREGTLGAVPLAAYGGVAAVAVLSNSVYALTTAAGKAASPVVTAVYGSTQPIMSWLLGAACFMQRLHAHEVYGALLILLGAFATVAIEDGENRSPGGGAQVRHLSIQRCKSCES